MSKTKRSHGFTLTEILIALAIIAILVAIAVPVIGGLMNKGTDTSEDVNAALYTSIMNKFAVEEVESTASYPRLTTTGSNPEYATFADKAGNGNFPGYNIIAGLGGADVLDQIRREAVIAIKAFSDTAVNDEYYITPPADSDYEYVYYYLTGEVKKEKRSDMTTTPSADLLTGNINIKDYWVYLSRDGGSGAALGGVANGTGYLFVQVLQYGTGQPLDGATVRVTSGATTYTAVTQPGQNGYVGFSGIPLGSVNVSIERHGAISFPDSRYYSKSGEVFISEGGYEGCQLNLPYVVDLKLGSLGSLGFYEEKVVWTEGRWDVARDKILDSVTVTSAFSPNTGNPGGVPRAETYTSNLYATAGVQQLLTGDKYLTYGNYNMTITSYGYRTYREAVTAKVFGIDNASGAYSGFTSAYEYPIIMKYPAGQSVVSGTIERESAEQPSQGTISGLSGTWAYTDNYYVYARVKLTNTSTGETYYSSYFSYDEEGKHDYTVSGLPDGTYLFEVESPYQHYDLSEFPETVTIDGRHVEVSGKLHREDAGEGEISGFVTYDFEGNYDPIAGVTVSFTRYGDDTSAASATTDEEGYYSVTGLTNGFYQMRVTLPYGLGGTTTYYKMFISGAEECDVELSLPTFTVYGYIEPYRDGSYLNVYNVLFDVEVTFYRIDMTGAKIYSSMTAYIEQEDVDAYYSIELVPGYYYVEITSVCFNDHRSSKLNFRDDANKNFELNLDLYDEDNHFEFYENCDDNGHWDECANCLEAFNFEEHTPSGWTYYSTSYCYRYCTVCGYNTTGLTSHNMSSYVSKAATCTETGTRVYYCTRGCGYTYTAVISKGGHTGNGVWVYDNNGSSSSAGTHHQNCKVCGTTMNAGTACSRASTKYSNGETNHYDSCSTCSGRRYFDHNWTEVSRTGYVCTGGTINYKCTDCGATKTGSYEATSAHNGRARCNVRHSCSWDTYCSAKGQHVWNGYYHILCSNCGAIQDHKWCAMHSDVSTVLQCPN